MRGVNNKIKVLIKNCSKFLVSTIKFVLFLSRLIRANHKHILKFESHIDRRIAIIATGPSLKDEIPYFSEFKYKNTTDFLMLNFSAFDPLFFELKPKHYCLADPMYFMNSWRDDEVFRFFDIINTQVDWRMTIYVPSEYTNQFADFSKLTNANITVMGVNTIAYHGYECFRSWFYRKGLSSPPPQTVTNLAVFIGIQCGYKEMDLFGVDHTFLSALKINEMNQLCQKYYHNYDKEEPEYKVIYRTDNNEVWRCGEYIVACGKMFISHDMLEKYAKRIGCHIVNHTKCSMIDSYERYAY